MKLTNLDAVKVSASTGLDAIRRAPIVDYITDIRCIRIQDVSQSKPFSQWGFTEVSKKDFSSRQLLKNDILIARTGATVGVNLIIRDTLNAVYNNGLIKLRVNEKENNPLFIYYVLQSEKYKQYIYSIAFGTVAQPNMKINDFLSFQFPKIDFKKQGFIAKILGDLDCKIEKNNQINETLEAMAQAIFKSWFVDFDPVKAKVEAKAKGLDDDAINRAAMRVIASKTDIELDEMQAESPAEYANLQTTASHFPDELVESELGMIPKGWEVEKVYELYSITIGRTPPRKEAKWFSSNSEDVKWLSIKDMAENNIFINKTSEYLTREAIKHFRVAVLPKNTVFLSFKMTVGRVNVANEDMCTNEAIAHFISEKEIPWQWTYLYLKNIDYNLLGSTSSIVTAINSKIIRNMDIIQPTQKLMESFVNQVDSVFNLLRDVENQILTLKELRDSLLPKLLSGEIEV